MLMGAEVLSLTQHIFYLLILLAQIIHKVLLGKLFHKAVHHSMNWDWKDPIIEETA